MKSCSILTIAFLQFIHFQMMKSNFGGKARASDEQYKDTLTTSLSSFHLSLLPFMKLEKEQQHIKEKKKIRHFKTPHNSLFMIRQKMASFGTYFPLFSNTSVNTSSSESTLLLHAPTSTQTEPQANNYFSCLRKTIMQDFLRT